ncbi:MAG: hypothetical protein ACK5GN_09375 [Pseudomonadota bacterium]
MEDTSASKDLSDLASPKGEHPDDSEARLSVSPKRGTSTPLPLTEPANRRLKADLLPVFLDEQLDDSLMDQTSLSLKL